MRPYSLLLPFAILACSPPRSEAPVANTTTAANEAPSADALAARAVVTHYFDLIAHRDYAAARLLWDNGGAASGGDAAAFARTFTPYATYEPTVGASTVVTSANGMEYVNVTTRVHVKRVDDGKEFDQQGPVMLRRPVSPGAGPNRAREWHIWGVDIRRPH